MSEPVTPDRPFYVTGGTLKPGEPSYVERQADTELFDSLLAGEFCYVLTARQMGKSSLMARTAKRLEQSGVASAIVDLTQIGSERGDQAATQWYFGIANQIHRQLGIKAPLRPWWQERSDLSSVQRLTDFFRELVLAEVPGRVVVFVDEIDSTIGLPFADDFFAALRACFNARATADAFERLSFVLLGVATPDQLIQDPARTPFNIGKRIDLTDFNLDEAQVLLSGLHSDPGEAGRRLGRVLHWTGGHPYLTQALCRAVRERGDTGTAEEAVDPQVEELFLSSRAQREETNLKHARARLEKPGPEGRRLLQLYRRVRQGKPVPDQPTSPLFAQLKLAGVVKATDEGRLAVRNRIYEAVFTAAWAKAAMPGDRGLQLAAATLAAAFVSALVWYVVFQPRPYEKAFRTAIEDDGYNTAFEAYTALRANPFSRSLATELMQEFWAQRALGYALTGKRDESLLSYLKGLELKDNEELRRQAGNLVGPDYERLRSTLRFAEDVAARALSSDGRIVATTSSGNTVRLRDTLTGKLLASLKHEEPVGAIAFSRDRQTVATGSSNGTARLWDARTGKLLMSLQGHEESVSGVDFSPDGRSVVTGSHDGTARLWDAKSGQPLSPLLRHERSVFAVVFSPDGHTVATGSRGTAQLWDAHSGELLTSLLLQESSRVEDVAFSPDGRTVATVFFAGSARLWDAQSGKPLVRLLPYRFFLDVAFSPDGRTVATGSIDGTVQLWDVQSGQPLQPPLRHEGAVFALTFSPDGRNLTALSRDTVQFWDVHSLKPSTLSSRDNTIRAIALSPDGQTVAMSSFDYTVLRDALTGKPLGSPLKHEGSIYALAFSPDGRTLATRANDDTARLWNAGTGRPLGPPLQHQGGVRAMTFSPDGRTLATGSDDDTARLWDTGTGRSLGLPLQHRGTVLAVAFSPDGQTLATGSGDDTARLWDAGTGKPFEPLLQHPGSVYAVAFSLDGRTLATRADDGIVRFWDTRTGKILTQLPLQLKYPQAIAFHPNGKYFFVATSRWLITYSWDGQKAVAQSSQLLQGFWRGAFRFSSDCESCLQAALTDTGNSFHLKTLHLDGPTDPPIEGDPEKLLKEWQARLGLKFDDQMTLVPR